MQSREVTVSGGYQQLEIYQLALKLAVDVHAMSLTLPRFETYEEGSQVRRSSKSIAANIVEGYGRRQYKNEFLKYVVYASASCDETKAHLEMLHQTGSLDKERYMLLNGQYQELGKKLYRFRQAVMSRHNQSACEDTPEYTAAAQHILEEDMLYASTADSGSPDSEPD